MIAWFARGHSHNPKERLEGDANPRSKFRMAFGEIPQPQVRVWEVFRQ